MPSEVVQINHPLVQHKLSLLRQESTHTQDFRRLLKEISLLLAYEVTRDLPLKYEVIKTPLAEMKAPLLAADKNMVIVSIMRAGQGLLDGMLELIPTAKVGHIGLYREPNTLTVVEYYLKLPHDVDQREMLVVDPMLATGNSAVAAVDRLKEANPLSIKFVCVLAAPEGIQHFQEQHPDVPIYTAAIDDYLDEHGYIVPGLGDAGDRLYGTK
ncbi:MAG TPA: uracil phosphoribosyltransferase [Synechococcales cyanobacterium M55_K2018_004]|nr:uracil phosphoribosyltransferase [Synechococcales cyanobacterium M55_K2018_004]